MRTITLICALLLLASCNSGPGPLTPAIQKPLFGTSDDSSPIIISDGSIHINQGKKATHFRIHGPAHASIKLDDYQPYVLGYGCNAAFGATTNPCNPSAGTAAPACTAGAATAPCQINVNPNDPSVTDLTTWALSICDSATCPAATMTWDSKDHETIHIKYTAGTFAVGNPGGVEANGPDLQSTSANHLQNASLVVTPPTGSPTTYTFACPNTLSTYPMCMTVGYECHVSGNATCGK